jgi:hypothetical protein
MSYLVKTAFEASQKVLGEHQTIENSLRFSVNPNKTHPTVLAFLYLYHASDLERNQNHHFSQILSLTFNDKIVSRHNLELAAFIHQQQAKEHKKLVVLCPSDELVGDFAHTKLPKGTKKDVDNFLKETLVCIEFPQRSTEKGVFLSAELVDGFYRSTLTGTTKRFSEVEKQVQENSKKFQDELTA